jgi:lysophospholipase L1-like esterase
VISLKKVWLAIPALILLYSAAACGQEEADTTISYVALGDSLAAGQTPYSDIDAGYADMIAEELKNSRHLASYTKDLAVPGFTTDDVLEGMASEDAEEVLASADLVTISAGANDLLRLVRLNPSNGSVSFGAEQVDAELDNIQSTMESILDKLKDQAPDAEVYVMGYYFPFPHLREEQKAELAERLGQLNDILKSTAEQEGAAFVPVDESFGEDAVDKLPNSADIHPNSEGYEAMADAFFDNYKAQ